MGQRGRSAEWMAPPAVHCGAQGRMACPVIFLNELSSIRVLLERVGPRSSPTSITGL